MTSARVWPMKSASKGFTIASICAVMARRADGLEGVDADDADDAVLEQPRGLDGHRAAHRMADQDDLLVRDAASAVATSWPKRAMAQSVRLPSVPPWPARSTVTIVYFCLNTGTCSRQ